MDRTLRPENYELGQALVDIQTARLSFRLEEIDLDDRTKYKVSTRLIEDADDAIKILETLRNLFDNI